LSAELNYNVSMINFARVTYMVNIYIDLYVGVLAFKFT